MEEHSASTWYGITTTYRRFPAVCFIVRKKYFIIIDLLFGLVSHMSNKKKEYQTMLRQPSKCKIGIP